jgi:hypothetical protein
MIKWRKSPWRNEHNQINQIMSTYTPSDLINAGKVDQDKRKDEKKRKGAVAKPMHISVY